MKLLKFIENALERGHTFDQIEKVVAAAKLKHTSKTALRSACDPPCPANQVCNGTRCIDDVDGTDCPEGGC